MISNTEPVKNSLLDNVDTSQEYPKHMDLSLTASSQCLRKELMYAGTVD